MTVRPDGGWGWVIAIACFTVNVIVDGVKYSFGIMFVELVDTFQRSKSDTSWIMSIQIGILSLSGSNTFLPTHYCGKRQICKKYTTLSEYFKEI